jgi:hypothetical protein
MVGGEIVPAGRSIPAFGAISPVPDCWMALADAAPGVAGESGVVVFVLGVVTFSGCVWFSGVLETSLPDEPGGNRRGSMVGGEIVPAGRSTPAFGAIKPVPDCVTALPLVAAAAGVVAVAEFALAVVPLVLAAALAVVPLATLAPVVVPFAVVPLAVVWPVALRIVPCSSD